MTSCLLAKKINAVEYRTIYVHNDGSPNPMLKLLTEHYSCELKVNELLDLGCASYITDKLYPDPSKPHNFNSPQAGISMFYGRDIGDTDTEAIIMTLSELKKTNNDYVYIWDKNCWRLLRR